MATILKKVLLPWGNFCRYDLAQSKIEEEAHFHIQIIIRSNQIIINANPLLSTYSSKARYKPWSLTA